MFAEKSTFLQISAIKMTILTWYKHSNGRQQHYQSGSWWRTAHTHKDPEIFNNNRDSDFFSRLVGLSDPWSKKWRVIFWNDGPKHIKLNTVDIWVVCFTYTLTQTCVCILTADYIVKPVLSGHSKRRPIITHCRSKVLQNAPRGASCNPFDLH